MHSPPFLVFLFLLRLEVLFLLFSFFLRCASGRRRCYLLFAAPSQLFSSFPSLSYPLPLSSPDCVSHLRSRINRARRAKKGGCLLVLFYPPSSKSGKLTATQNRMQTPALRNKNVFFFPAVCTQWAPRVLLWVSPFFQKNTGESSHSLSLFPPSSLSLALLKSGKCRGEGGRRAFLFLLLSWRRRRTAAFSLSLSPSPLVKKGRPAKQKTDGRNLPQTLIKLSPGPEIENLRMGQIHELFLEDTIWSVLVNFSAVRTARRALPPSSTLSWTDGRRSLVRPLSPSFFLFLFLLCGIRREREKVAPLWFSSSSSSFSPAMRYIAGRPTEGEPSSSPPFFRSVRLSVRQTKETPRTFSSFGGAVFYKGQSKQATRKRSFLLDW